ncbi:hypothetical protein ADUPG1_008975, partial [Aduncisulcus paluster]
MPPLTESQAQKKFDLLNRHYINLRKAIGGGNARNIDMSKKNVQKELDKLPPLEDIPSSSDLIPLVHEIHTLFDDFEAKSEIIQQEEKAKKMVTKLSTSYKSVESKKTNASMLKRNLPLLKKAVEQTPSELIEILPELKEIHSQCLELIKILEEGSSDPAPTVSLKPSTLMPTPVKPSSGSSSKPKPKVPPKTIKPPGPSSSKRPQPSMTESSAVKKFGLELNKLTKILSGNLSSPVAISNLCKSSKALSELLSCEHASAFPPDLVSEAVSMLESIESKLVEVDVIEAEKDITKLGSGILKEMKKYSERRKDNKEDSFISAIIHSHLLDCMMCIVYPYSIVMKSFPPIVTEIMSTPYPIPVSPFIQQQSAASLKLVQEYLDKGDIDSAALECVNLRSGLWRGNDVLSVLSRVDRALFERASSKTALDQSTVGNNFHLPSLSLPS